MINAAARVTGATALLQILRVGQVHYRSVTAYIDSLNGSETYLGGDPVEELAGVNAALQYARDKGLINIGAASSVVRAIQMRIDKGKYHVATEQPTRSISSGELGAINTGTYDGEESDPKEDLPDLG